VQVGAVFARQQQVLDGHRQAYQEECGGTIEENERRLGEARAEHHRAVHEVEASNAAVEARAHDEWQAACAVVADFNEPRLAQQSVEHDIERAQQDVSVFAASLSKYTKYLKEHGRSYNANAQVRETQHGAHSQRGIYYIGHCLWRVRYTAPTPSAARRTSQ
jgi:hypothetical protein